MVTQLCHFQLLQFNSVTLKETYENVKILLASVKYDEHKWLMCGDLKIIAIIFGQSGYSKFPCFFGTVELIQNIMSEKNGSHENSLGSEYTA